MKEITSNIKILLIEDNPGDARLFEEYLKEEQTFSYSCQIAQSIKTASDLCKQFEYDLIILDLNLPDSSGIDTFDRIKSESPDIPIIALSGQDDPELHRKIIQLGAQDFLVKGKLDSKLLVKSIYFALERFNYINELGKSHDEYRLFFEQDLTGDFISTADGILLNGNPAYLKMLGFKSLEEARGYDVKKLYLNPSEREKIINQLIKNKTIINHEYQMQRIDGKIVDLIANIYGEFDNSGSLIKIKGYIFDNTERKKAEDENRKLARAVEQSPAIVVITDANGNIEYVNSKFTELTGYSKEDVLGKNPRILKSGQTSPDEYKKMWKTILSGKQWKGEFLNRKKDGTLYWESARITQIKNSKGEISHFLALKQDITERKKAEKIQRALFNISTSANSSHTLEKLLENIRKELGNLIDVSNFYVALFDEEKKTISIAYHSDGKLKHKDFPQGNTLTRYILQTQKPFWGRRKDIDQLEKQGAIEFHGIKAKVWMGIPLTVKGETIGAFVIQSYDNENAFNKDDLNLLVYISNKISQAVERKKNEQLLKNALAKAQESDRLKSAFLAAMSHELRTPLNAIIGFSELMNKNLNSHDIEEFAQIIHKSGKHLLEIVESIFDITLIESGETQLNNIEFRLDDMIESLMEVISGWQQNNKSNIKVHLHSSKELSGIQIISDRKKLIQILTNLLKNALKFTEKGHIEIGYFLKTENQKTCIEFYVKDTGIGIPPEAQEVIFDMFRQADDTHTRKYEGIGIGLTVAKRLVELMNGNIWVDSKQKVGSTFHFTIPYLPVENSVLEKEKTIQTINDINLSGKTILIAEDEISNFQLLQTIFSKTKTNILWAKNGKEALDVCFSNPKINLVLMDIKMPQMNGLEATKEIKKKCPNLPIIAQTAYTLNGDHQKAQEAGCNDYIEKPIQKKKLFNILTKYI